MSITDRLKNIFGRKALPSRLWDAMIFRSGGEAYSRWDKQRLIEQGYERNAAFYSAANLIAQTVATIPIYVEYDSVGRKLTSTDHPLLELMTRDTSREEFVSKAVLYWLVCGESYAQIVYSQDGRPIGLVVIPSQFINPIQGDYLDPIIGFKYREYREVTFDPKEVVYWTFPNLREYFHGMSAGVPLGELLDLNNAAITWNKNVALGGGVPPIVAKAAGITPEQANELKDSWQQDAGANNSHRLRVVSENLQFEKMGMAPHDAEWSNATISSMRMIFMSLGVSSELMNDAGNKTYSNYQEARKALYMETAIPLAKRFYATLGRSLASYYRDNPKIVIDTNAIEAIQEDRQNAVQRLTIAVEKGIMTPNEAREELGFARISDERADLLQLKA